MDFVGGMAAVLLLLGHDENKLKNQKITRHRRRQQDGATEGQQEGSYVNVANSGGASG